jgi:SAM-dependent methyltransferase
MCTDVLAAWIAALETRHMTELRRQELTRALRALSSAYVERRHRVSHGAPLDSPGKRAAFALFFGPLHFIAVKEVVARLGADDPAPARILDIGCGTGAAGAAWALACGGRCELLGIDRHPWAIGETRWTYRYFSLHGRARRATVLALPASRPGDAVIASYVLNELPEATRLAVEHDLLARVERGAGVLVIEPIARPITPWWDETVKRFAAVGARADEWRLPAEMPPALRMLGRAAGLGLRELTMRSLYVQKRGQ